MSPRMPLALLGVAFATLAAPLAAQVASAPTPQELDAKLPFDPLVRVGTLDNGLRYYIMANTMPEKRAELRLAVRVGSVYEGDNQRGLAHVTEHMAFNGTTSFPKNDIVHYLQSIGSRFGADVNAYTSFDETVYMLQVPTDTGNFLSKGIQILGEWASGVTFDPAEIDAERGVVIEEWRLRRGAGARMQDQQFPVILQGSRYADRMIIGTLESLQGFSHDALRSFYRDWYRPDLMAVVAVGDFDPDEVERMVRERFAGLPRGTPRTHESFPVPGHDSVYVAIATDREATNSTFQVYNVLPRRDLSTVRGFRDRYVERLGLAMLNARLSELVQRPNPPFAFAGASRGYFVRSADAATLVAGVREGGILGGLDAALTEVERASRYGFTQTEFLRALANAQQQQQMLYAERDKRASATRAAELLRNFLQDEDVLGSAGEYHLYQRINPTITLDEVNRVTKALLSATSPVIAVSAPETSGSAVPTEAQVLAVYQAVKSKTLEPYRDNVITGPLLARSPIPAAITAESRIADVDVTEWTLANGVRVVLKPTDFMNDQVVLTGTSPGGMSLLPDSMVVPATFATMAANVGGLGELNAIDLRKILTGKTASASLSIGERTENAFGTSSMRDVETMLQLLYLRFTAPRRDSSAFLAFRQALQAQLANASASPQKAFSDTISMTLSQGSPRVPMLGPELLDELDLDQALAIYRDRFADASDFTFFIVGNFNVDSIRPMVERYLGGLPSLRRKESGRDAGVAPPEGRVEKVVRRGVEPQSQTFMAFTGTYAFSARDSYLMSSLGELLSNRLIESLREKLGGTYGASAQISGSRDTPQRYMATIQFGSAPERAEELTMAVLAEIESLSTTGPTQEEVDKVREGQLRARETALKTNFFWTSQLSRAYQYGDDPREILEYDKLVQELTADALRDAARRYLQSDNYIHVTLLPQQVTP